MSVFHSGSVKNDDESNGAANAVDQNFKTRSFTEPNADGVAWFKISLDRNVCVEEVITHSKLYGSQVLAWTCSRNDCSSCEGRYCGRLTLTVSGGGKVPGDLPPDCKYGDTLMLVAKRTDSDNGRIILWEVSFTTKQGPVLGDLTNVTVLSCTGCFKKNVLISYGYIFWANQ